MKRKIVTLFLALGMTAAAMTGCGGASSDSSSVANVSAASANTAADIVIVDDSKEKYDPSENVTIMDYHDAKVTEAEKHEVTDEEAKTFAEQNRELTEVTDENATVEDGDTVNIDFAGKMNGEAFDGGTAQGYELVIGSGSFIEGFEDGLIGAKKGETRTLELTFPENYNEDLAGKDVEFEVTINSISRAEGELTDEDIEAARAELEEQNELYQKQNTCGEIWEQIENSAKIKAYPKSYIDGFSAEYKSYYTDASEEEVRDYAANVAKNALIVDVMQKEMDIKEDTDEYKKALADIMEQYGITSEEELKKQIGEMNAHYFVIQTIIFDRIYEEMK